MKKVIIYLCLFFSLLSCNDMLNVESEESVTYLTYFKSERDVESILTSMFLTERTLFAPNRLTFVDKIGLLCDDLLNEGFRTLEPKVFLKENELPSWSGYYDLIYLTNMLEENQWRFEGITKERAEFWLAEANFMKALSYFQIARIWGEAPIMKSSENSAPVAKSSVKEVLAEAIRCAEKALVLPNYERLADSDGNKINSKQYASLGTVHTLLANIYAWRGGLYHDKADWEKAEHYASFVIDQKSGFYELESSITSLQRNVFGKVRSSSEVIFDMELNAADGDYWSISWFLLKYPGWGMFSYPLLSANPKDLIDNWGNWGSVQGRISVRSVKKLYPEAGDLRRDHYWYQLGKVEYIEDDESVVSPWAYFYKWKEPYHTGNMDYRNPVVVMEGNRVVWRLADVILLRAECRARLGLETAVDDLDRIRGRAGLSGYSGPRESETLRKEIFMERDREMIGEVTRYFDIVRNGYLEVISKEYTKLSEADIENGALYLPIREGAMGKDNTLLKQNKYWLWRR